MFNLSNAIPRPQDDELGPRPDPFPRGTPIGLHLRVERLIRVNHSRTYYLVNNKAPRWYTRKCWLCGNKHSPPTAQACTYCSAPLGTRRFLMTSRWHPASCEAFEGYANRRLVHDALASPVALYRYHEQLLAVYPWNHDTLLLGEPSPLTSEDVLRATFNLADALSHLHNYGVILHRINPGNILLAPDGQVRLFDLEVERLSDRPIRPCEDFTQPPLRDLRDVCEILGQYCPVEDEELRTFLKNARRGQWETADLLAGAATQFSTRRRGSFTGLSTAAGMTDAGMVRALNEDAFQWRRLGTNARLFAVADGMGGHFSGEVASQLATRSACRAVQRKFGDKTQCTFADAPKLLAEGFEQANLAVCTYAHEHRRHMGTTLVCALHVVIDGKSKVWIGHSGDSRAYLLRDGELRRLTEDHSMVAAMVAAGKITEAEARTHPKSNVLLSFLGNSEDLEPDIEGFDVDPGDRILMCSDGLWGELVDEDIERILGTDIDPRRSVNRLLRAANDAGGSDNVTAVVLDIPWD
ncbi:MAG: serine/threonine protein phosphatase PrpC [Myxococcota bacterium]|jgi:serine/threonine protein phosphatase PrpC